MKCRSTHSGRSGHGRTVFFARHRVAHAQITLFAKLDVGRAKPRLKQLSGAGKSTMIALKILLYEENLLRSIYKVLSTHICICTSLLLLYKVLTTVSFPLKHSKTSKIVQTGVLYALVGLCLQYTMEHNLNTHQVQSTFHFQSLNFQGQHNQLYTAKKHLLF